MSKFKKVIAICAMLGLLYSTAFAETNTITYKAKMENGEVTVEEKNLIGEVDNSNLDVNVIKQQGDTRTTIFAGKLKDYDNGRWANLDFSEIQFALILDWDTMENEAICIVPAKSDTASTEKVADEISTDTELSKSSTQETK